MLISGSIAALGLVIALVVIFFRVNASHPAASPHNVLWTLTSLQVNGQTHAETLLVSGNAMTITGAGGNDILRFSSSHQ